MGNGESKIQKDLIVITLNYSGILLSPFEFYSKQSDKMTKIEKSLSEIFLKLLKKKFPNFDKQQFKWNLGKIDQKMQSQRYTPLYNPKAGIVNNKLIGQKQFCQIWTKTFDEAAKKMEGFAYQKQQKQRAQQFDLMCYQCIVSHLYKVQTLQNIEKQKDIHIYEDFMRFMFSKSFLNEKKKLQKTLDAMDKQKIDIVFAQQASQQLIELIETKYSKKYIVFKKQKAESIIICNRNRFTRYFSLNSQEDPLSHMPKQIAESLNWNNDTIVVFVDNMILISGHLSSKKQKNAEQVKAMMQSLERLYKIYPMCEIIVGCDANSFVPHTVKQLPKNCLIYPTNESQYTTSKQRTYLQPQVNKAEVMAQVCRDHLIIFTHNNNLKMNNSKVCTILNQKTKKVPNLPCENHPYDHYVVKSDITLTISEKH